MALSIRQAKLLAAAKMRPPRIMMLGGAIQEPELCSYCTRKYTNNDEVYATPGCLLKNETLPKFGGEISREIRRHLRSNREKDSKPSLRDEIEGVYEFPACCSCCKCSSCAQRYADNGEQKYEGDDNDGGDGGGLGDGGGFFDGIHDGYSANEKNYLYMITGAKKGYRRALCLQEEVRFSVPNVGYSFVGEDGEEIMESICSSWPDGNHPMHFLDNDSVILRRKVIFADAPGVSETLFLCNCRCGDGKAGLTLQEEMERVISYYSEESNLINRGDFSKIIQRLYGNYRLTRQSDMVVSLLCMECVHTRALKTACNNQLDIDVPECPILEKTAAKLISDKTFLFDVKKAMNVVEEAAANQMDEVVEEEDAAAAKNYLHSLMVPRICLCGDGLYHAVGELRKATVFASEDPFLRFGSFIQVSARMVPKCTRCERDSCRCVYVGHLDEIALLGLRPSIRQRPPQDDDSFEELDVHENIHINPHQAIAHSHKLRSFSLAPYSNEYPDYVDPFRKRCHELPQLLKPPTICDCKRDVSAVGEDNEHLPLHCRCSLMCSCGEFWDPEICTPSQKLLVLGRDFPMIYDVCGLTCPRGICDKRLQFDGREHGITILFCGQTGPLAGFCVAIATVWLLDIVKSLYDSYDPLTRLYDIMIYNYRVGEFNPIYSLPKSTFFYYLQAVIVRLILPAFPSRAYECITCGPSPPAMVYDGTGNGIRRKNAPAGSFNQYEGMSEVPSILNPSIIRPALYNAPPKVPVHLLKETVTWDQLTTFAGPGAVKRQETLLRFCRAKSDIPLFTEANLDAALVLFDGPLSMDRAVTFMLEYYKSNELLVPVRNFGPVLQVIAAKSVAPITGAHGSLLVALYSLLAMGISGSSSIPAVFHSLISPAKVAMLDAKRIVAREGRMPVDAAQDATNVAAIDDLFLSLEDLVPAWSTDDSKFAGELAMDVLQTLLEKKYMRTVSNVVPITIIDVATSFFPQLGNFLRDLPSQIAPAWSRPLLACMSKKCCDLWLRPQSYYLLVKDYSTRNPFVPGFTKRRNFLSLEEVMAATDDTTEPRASISLQLLTELVECETRIETTTAENSKTGLVTVPLRSVRPMRQIYYLKDFIRKNLASKAIQSGLTDDMPAEEGDLGLCEKGTPKSSFFTPGIYTGQCACKRPCLSYLRYMDSYESPSYLMNAEFMTKDQPTPVLLYDAACMGHAYAMAREPDYFFSTRFMSDRFHQCNHTTCAWRYRSSEYRDECIFWNTAAAEQINAIMEKKCRSTRWNNLPNAVASSHAFFAQHNVDSYWKATDAHK